MDPNRWFFQKDRLVNSPSRLHGIAEEKELTYIQQVANFIQELGRKLSLPLICINTGILFTQRFYIFHSLKDFEKHALAASALFLAAKVEEHPRKVEHVCKAVRFFGLVGTEIKDADYIQELIFNESVLLQTLGFDLHVQHPHQHVLRLSEFVKVSKDLSHVSYILATHCLHLTRMCLLYKPAIVACVCVHLACKALKWQFPKENKPWFLHLDSSVTVDLLEQLGNEFAIMIDKCPEKYKSRVPFSDHPHLLNKLHLALRTGSFKSQDSTQATIKESPSSATSEGAPSPSPLLQSPVTTSEMRSRGYQSTPEKASLKKITKQAPHVSHDSNYYNKNDNQTSHDSHGRSTNKNDKHTPHGTHGTHSDNKNDKQTPHGTHGTHSYNKNDKHTLHGLHGIHSINKNDDHIPHGTHSHNKNDKHTSHDSHRSPNSKNDKHTPHDSHRSPNIRNDTHTPHDSHGSPNSNNDKLTPQDLHSSHSYNKNDKHTLHGSHGSQSYNKNDKHTPHGSHSSHSYNKNDKHAPRSSHGGRPHYNNDNRHKPSTSFLNPKIDNKNDLISSSADPSIASPFNSNERDKKMSHKSSKETKRHPDSSSQCLTPKPMPSIFDIDFGDSILESNKPVDPLLSLGLPLTFTSMPNQTKSGFSTMNMNTISEMCKSDLAKNCNVHLPNSVERARQVETSTLDISQSQSQILPCDTEPNQIYPFGAETNNDYGFGTTSNYETPRLSHPKSNFTKSDSFKVSIPRSRLDAVTANHLNKLVGQKTDQQLAYEQASKRFKTN